MPEKIPIYYTKKFICNSFINAIIIGPCINSVSLSNLVGRLNWAAVDGFSVVFHQNTRCSFEDNYIRISSSFFWSENSLNMPHFLSYFKYDCWNMQINSNQVGFQNTSPTTSCDTHTHYGATIHKSYYRIPTTKSIFHLCRMPSPLPFPPTPRTR